MMDFDFMHFDAKEARKKRLGLYAVFLAALILLIFAAIRVNSRIEKDRLDALQKQAVLMAALRKRKTAPSLPKKTSHSSYQALFLMLIAKKIPQTVSLTKIKWQAKVNKLMGTYQSLSDLFNFIHQIAEAYGQTYQVSIVKNHGFNANLKTIRQNTHAKIQNTHELRQFILTEIYKKHIRLSQLETLRHHQITLSFLASFDELLHFLTLFPECQTTTLTLAKQVAQIKVHLSCPTK